MKRLFAFFIVFFTFYSVIAQRIIPRFGVTYPKISFSDKVLNQSTQRGVAFGLGYEVRLFKHLILQPELGFTQKGCSFNYWDSRRELTLNYFEVSLPLKFNFGYPNLKFHFLAGPSFGIGIGGKYRIDSNGSIENFSVLFMSYDYNGDSYRYFANVDNQIDLSAQIGFGLELYQRVIIDFRYQKGYSKLYTEKNREEYNNNPILHAKNSLWQISLGVPINISYKTKDGEVVIPKRSKFVPMVGFSFPWITLNGNEIKQKSKLAYSLGFAYNLDLSKNFSFKPELRFIQKGMDFEDANNRHQLTLYYLETALPLKYSIGNNNVTLYSYFGPTIGVGIDGRYKYISYYSRSTNVHFSKLPIGSSQEDYYAYVDNRFEFGYQFGVGVELFKRLNFEVSYEHGLTKLYTTKNRDLFKNASIQDAKNRLWLVRFGIPLNYREKRTPSVPSKLIAKAGISISKMSYSFDMGTSNKLGFTIGVGYESELFKNVFIQPELNFIQKGAKWGFDEGDNHTMTINFLETPILFKYKFGIGKLKFNLMAGPSFSYGLGGNYKAEFNGTLDKLDLQFKPYHESDNYNEKYSFIDRRIEMGATVGIGVELFEIVMIDVRYNYGFTELYTDWNRNLTGSSKILKDVKTSGYQITVGVPLQFR